jgi:hypothetical protein
LKNKLMELAVKAQLGWDRAKKNLTNERGEAVTWVVLVIVCIIIVVAAYLKFKSAGGNVGTAINTMGADAVTGLGQVKTSN